MYTFMFYLKDAKRYSKLIATWIHQIRSEDICGLQLAFWDMVHFSEVADLLKIAPQQLNNPVPFGHERDSLCQICAFLQQFAQTAYKLQRAGILWNNVMGILYWLCATEQDKIYEINSMSSLSQLSSSPQTSDENSESWWPALKWPTDPKSSVLCCHPSSEWPPGHHSNIYIFFKSYKMCALLLMGAFISMSCCVLINVRMLAMGDGTRDCSDCRSV